VSARSRVRSTDVRDRGTDGAESLGEFAEVSPATGVRGDMAAIPTHSYVQMAALCSLAPRLVGRGYSRRGWSDAAGRTRPVAADRTRLIDLQRRGA
jgi:hypothetical protein